MQFLKKKVKFKFKGSSFKSWINLHPGSPRCQFCCSIKEVLVSYPKISLEATRKNTSYLQHLD